MAIPPARRLNKLSPLVQLHGLSLNEAILGVGGRIGGKTQGRKNIATGHLSRLRPLQIIAGRKIRDMQIGIFAPDFDRSKNGRLAGLKAKELDTGIHAQTQKDHTRLGSAAGQKHKKNHTGIFAPGTQALGGRTAALSGQLAKAREVLAIKRFLKTVAYG